MPHRGRRLEKRLLFLFHGPFRVVVRRTVGARSSFRSRKERDAGCAFARRIRLGVVFVRVVFVRALSLHAHAHRPDRDGQHDVDRARDGGDRQRLQRGRRRVAFRVASSSRAGVSEDGVEVVVHRLRRHRADHRRLDAAIQTLESAVLARHRAELVEHGHATLRERVAVASPRRSLRIRGKAARAALGVLPGVEGHQRVRAEQREERARGARDRVHGGAGVRARLSRRGIRRGGPARGRREVRDV